jgi:hypothetical protein
MYTDKYLTEEIQPAKEAAYRKIFCTEFNYYFQSPKKDQCDICMQFRNTIHISEEFEQRYKMHCEQKEKARQVKEEAKMKAKSEDNVIAACFDLEKVLNCPHGQVSSFYYHRKLSVYNLTVYSLGSGSGFCYTWPVVIACRGAIEVARCLYDFIHGHAVTGGKTYHIFPVSELK